MNVSFEKIFLSMDYSRKELAEIWGYTSFHAIARGVVTPRGDNKIILFVTEEKQTDFEQYADSLHGNVLEWEGPTDHFAEVRILNSDKSGDEIHLFHRDRHHASFTYYGRLRLESYTLNLDRPSRFTFEII